MTARQRGLALPMILVLLSLSALASLQAWRQLWLGEWLLNAQADHLRTQFSAEAVLHLATRDIAGNLNLATTQRITTNALSQSITPDLRHVAGDANSTHVFFPKDWSEWLSLRQRLGRAICRNGICIPSLVNASNVSQANFWRGMTTQGMAVDAAQLPPGLHAAWYWVEVLVEADAKLQISNNKTTAVPAAKPYPFNYRITVYAQGLRTGSAVVIQTLWTKGQWRSWRVLND